MVRILVAEDDPKQGELVRRYAVAAGYEVTVVDNGRDAVDLVRAAPPDLVVLDVMMPGMDGLDVCRVLRADESTHAVPILMLTARAAEDDMLLGFDLGADDYLGKPYSPRELMARVRSLLRRRQVDAAERGRPDVTLGALTVTPRTHEVRWHGALVSCTPGELVLLETMAAEPGRVFSRAQLLTRLHGHGDAAYVTPRTVDVHVANLRRKLDPALIRTVHGVGYAAVVPSS